MHSEAMDNWTNLSLSYSHEYFTEGKRDFEKGRIVHCQRLRNIGTARMFVFARTQVGVVPNRGYADQR